MSVKDMTIWKFSLPVADEVTIKMPAGALVLSVAADGVDRLHVWAKVWPDADTVSHRFWVRGTGHPMGDAHNHVGTVHAGPFVWHLFDGGDVR